LDPHSWPVGPWGTRNEALLREVTASTVSVVAWASNGRRRGVGCRACGCPSPALRPRRRLVFPPSCCFFGGQALGPTLRLPPGLSLRWLCLCCLRAGSSRVPRSSFALEPAAGFCDPPMDLPRCGVPCRGSVGLLGGALLPIAATTAIFPLALVSGTRRGVLAALVADDLRLLFTRGCGSVALLHGVRGTTRRAVSAPAPWSVPVLALFEVTSSRIVSWAAFRLFDGASGCPLRTRSVVPVLCGSCSVPVLLPGGGTPPWSPPGFAVPSGGPAPWNQRTSTLRTPVCTTDIRRSQCHGLPSAVSR